MVLEEVFTEPVYRLYRAPSCSTASLFMKIINILKYFLPLLTIFLTEGLWHKTGTFRETPKISLNGDFIIFAAGNDKSLIATSYSVLNSAASADQLVPSQQSHHFDEIDNNNRRLNIDIEMSTGNMSINSIVFAFGVNFELDYHSIVQIETFLTDSLQLSHPTSKVIINARLDVDQSVPFKKIEKWQTIDRNRLDVSHFQIHSILQRESSSPMSLTMKRKSSIFLTSPSPPQTFSISLHLSISEIQFVYKTGFWELLKWAWIQYFAAFIIFNHILTSISSYLFQNHVLFARETIKNLSK